MKKFFILMVCALIGTGLVYSFPGKKTIDTKGYKGIVELGGGVGVGQYGDEFASLSTSHGYQFNPYLFLGLGVGLDYHFDYETVYIPIFIDARFNFKPIDKKITPYVGMKVGYAFVDDYSAYLSPHIGVKFPISKKLNMSVSAVYSMQRIDVNYYSGNSYLYTLSGSMGGVGLKVGIEF